MQYKEQIERKTKENIDIGQVIREYKTKPHKPELITATWQILWKAWGEKVSIIPTVPLCDRTKEELLELTQKNRMMVYVPDELAAGEDVRLLGRCFSPWMGQYITQKGYLVANEHNYGGWYDIELNIDASYTDTTEDQIKDIFALREISGQRLNTYIIGSLASNLFFGRYFDSGRTWSRLPGSYHNGLMIGAGFNSDEILVYWGLKSEYSDSSLGYRTEGSKIVKI